MRGMGPCMVGKACKGIPYPQDRGSPASGERCANRYPLRAANAAWHGLLPASLPFPPSRWAGGPHLSPCGGGAIVALPTKRVHRAMTPHPSGRVFVNCLRSPCGYNGEQGNDLRRSAAQLVSGCFQTPRSLFQQTCRQFERHRPRQGDGRCVVFVVDGHLGCANQRDPVGNENTER